MTEARGLCLLQGLVDGPARLLESVGHRRCAGLAAGLQLAWLQGPQSLAFTDHASRTDTAKNDTTPSRTHQFKFAGSNWGTWFGPHSNQNDFVKVRVVGHVVGTVSIYRAIDAQGWGMSIHSDLGVSEEQSNAPGSWRLMGA